MFLFPLIIPLAPSSLQLPQASSLVTLPSLFLQDCLSMNWLFPAQGLFGLGNLHHSKARADRELHTNGREQRSRALWEWVWTWVKLTWTARCSCRDGSELFGTKSSDRWHDMQGLVNISFHPHPHTGVNVRLLLACLRFFFWSTGYLVPNKWQKKTKHLS